MTERIPGSPKMGQTNPENNQACPSLTRRQLLAGTGKVALFAMLPLGCVPKANLPFADGTFWNDGSGWTT